MTYTQIHIYTYTHLTYTHIHIHTYTYTHTHELPCIAGCSHFTRKSIVFRAAGSSPTQVPCNLHAAMKFCFEHHVHLPKSPNP